MGSLGGRISRLEGRIVPGAEEDEGQALCRELMRATLDELARLKASRAVGFRRTMPEDIPGQYLAKPYTYGQLVDLAIKLVWEREELPADLMEPWLQGFKEFCGSAGADLEEIEDDGT